MAKDRRRSSADARARIDALESELAEARAQQTATAEVLRIINSSLGNRAAVFEAILEKARVLCGAAHGSLSLYDGERFRAVAINTGSQELADRMRQGFSASELPYLEPLLDGARLVQVPDLAKAGNPYGARTGLFVPLRKDDALLGLIATVRLELRPFSDEEIALVENFAAQATIAMENARLLTETREALEVQTATAEVLQVINSSPGNLAPVFDAILERAHHFCDAPLGSFVLNVGERWPAVATRGYSAEHDELARREGLPNDAPAIQRLARGEIVHTPDLTPFVELSAVTRAAVESSGSRTYLAVPLRKDGILLGYLSAHRQEVRPFSDKQIALLQNFAAQAVIAIENARLLTETREALKQQTATAEVLQVINSSPGDLAPVFDAMLEKAHSLCGADNGTLLTYDGERFWPVAWQGVSGNLVNARSEGIDPAVAPSFGRIVRGALLDHVHDMQEFAANVSDDAVRRRLTALVQSEGVRTQLIVALRKDDVLRGAITANRKVIQPFSDNQIALLQNFAAQAVIAMENARLLGETREALEQQTATAEVLQVINASPGNLTPVFDAMLTRAMALCEADYGHIYTFDGEEFETAAIQGEPEFVSWRRQRGAIRPQGDGTSALERLVAGERVVWFADVTREQAYSANPRFRELAEAGGIRSMAVVALHKERVLQGAINVYRRQVRPFSDKQIALLQNFAAQAVIAMENARLLTETREALEQQTATAEVLGVINASPGNLSLVFEAMLERAMRLCGAAFGTMLRYHGEYFETVAACGVPTRFADAVSNARMSFGPGTGPARLLEGEPFVHILDAGAEEAYRNGDLSRRQLVDLAGARTLVSVPLSKEGALLGVFTVYRQEVRPFSDKQIALLQSFAAQAVIAMENARLLTETREALTQQTATAEVLGVINSSPGNLAPVFDAILEKARAICGFTQGSLNVFDGEYFRTVATRGVPEAFAEVLRQPRRTGPQARFLDGERIVHITDVTGEPPAADDPVYRAAIAAGIRTVLFVPLRNEERLLGYLTANRQEVRPFTDKEIALLENFAAQAVIAMENARLLGELRQRTDEIAKLNRGLEARVAEQVEELGRVGRLKRFLAPQLAELIVSQGDEKILESHRREIVVVFCDLRGYTAFTETAEPEEVLDFLREYHGALGPLVSQFEGTLDQFSGDGIMVFFNDPVPIPDPAERAVRMSIAMREAASELIASWRRRRGRVLGFGVGIAQGYATLGQIGFAERSGYTAIGTVCNLAARLCAEAKDGQILLAQRVAVAVEETTPIEEVGELTLKGLSQPVVAYNVPLATAQLTLRVIEGGPPSV